MNRQGASVVCCAICIDGDGGAVDGEVSGNAPGHIQHTGVRSSNKRRAVLHRQASRVHCQSTALPDSYARIGGLDHRIAVIRPCSAA